MRIPRAFHAFLHAQIDNALGLGLDDPFFYPVGELDRWRLAMSINETDYFRKGPRRTHTNTTTGAQNARARSEWKGERDCDCERGSRRHAL